VLLEPEVRDDAAAERAGLAERLGWQVNDQDLFAQALAHRSWCAEHPRHEPNERLEFLGDAVLGQIVTDYLYRSYPDLPEGELAKARAAVVNSASLAGTARELRVGNALLLGKGEDSSGGRLKPSILADAMEALIGAIYLDVGYAAADTIVLRLLEERLREAAKGPGEDDYKTRLQELCAQSLRRAACLPGHRQRAGPRQGLRSPSHRRGPFQGEWGRPLEEASRADGCQARLVHDQG
jgi:ribonuclease-3